ncbi:probable leucine--tRNA ligase, mitochondrial isoform X2 [Ischnura elegans]|uniref:probable leucine--tRNA ligase, mitochondrial isoform X2 n=1 Tax=Ischnura elegans TaxID=197161 RepID=UPI001ED8816A|nr:probable leucine--tRNA ligase, mitochondrial isoform X2 [Ischnura elegans]
MNVKRWVIIFGNMKQKFALKYQWSSGSFRTYSVRGISAWQEDLTPTTKHVIEKFWANRLPETPCYDDSKPKFYVLSMFPYPSGQLHMGHVRVYTISDVMARFYRMKGKNVIHPMGWDAFGLPAENAARENNIAPSVWTYNNIDRMKNQLLRLGCSFDWNRELATCDAEYYKWTQSLFLKLHSRGMVYQREALVNWDPVDETVLADEQVDGQGRSWRSGAKVEKRWLKQWFIRSTQFAKALMEGLDDPSLIDWRDIIKLQQHWIGPCSGTTIDFDVVLGGEESVGRENRWTLTVWTEHPECLLGASFIAIRPDSDLHLLCKEKGILMKNSTSQTVGSNRPWQRLPCWAHHPITGQKLPLIALDEKCDDDDVMMDVAGFLGTHGCRLGLPGENSLDLKIAVNEGFSINSKMVDEKGCMLPSAGPDLSGLSVADARAVVCEKARALGVGGHHVSPSLKDWLISRQRYWGTPIPMVHCPNCGAVPVPPDQLPVLLPPPQPSASGGGRGVPTLNRNEQWKQTSCPQCGGSAERETDTMDTFVDSSWYFLRYLDPKNASAPFCPEKAKKFMPVDLYIGGKEHAVLHLYYARFMSHFLHSEGLLPNPEPFRRMLVQGMIMGKTYRAKKSGKYLRASDVEAQGKKVFERTTKEPVSVSWEKMSKSKGNGVEPSDMIEEHGADTTRLLVLADVAPTSHRKWMPETFPGIINWQRRLWLTMRRFRELRSSEELLPKGDHFESEEQQMWDSRNFYLKGATFNYSASHQLSVAISKMQGLSNALKR